MGMQTSNYYSYFTNILDYDGNIPDFLRNVENDLFNFLDQETQNPNADLNIDVSFDNISGTNAEVIPKANIILFYSTDTGEINIDFRTIVNVSASYVTVAFDSILVK